MTTTNEDLEAIAEDIARNVGDELREVAIQLAGEFLCEEPMYEDLTDQQVELILDMVDFKVRDWF